VELFVSIDADRKAQMVGMASDIVLYFIPEVERAIGANRDSETVKPPVSPVYQTLDEIVCELVYKVDLQEWLSTDKLQDDSICAGVVAIAVILSVQKRIEEALSRLK
jgi:predicted class III extradiol MEMO1 family dioxygenase